VRAIAPSLIGVAIVLLWRRQPAAGPSPRRPLGCFPKFADVTQRIHKARIVFVSLIETLIARPLYFLIGFSAKEDVAADLYCHHYL